MNHRNFAVTETARLSLGMLLCLCLMSVIYILLGRFSANVLSGGMIGTLLAVGNFFFMSASLAKISSEEDSARVILKVRGSYSIRMAILLVIAVFAIKYLNCDPLATLIPLLYIRLVLAVLQFIVNSKLMKSKEQEDESGN